MINENTQYYKILISYYKICIRNIKIFVEDNTQRFYTCKSWSIKYANILVERSGMFKTFPLESIAYIWPWWHQIGRRRGLHKTRHLEDLWARIIFKSSCTPAVTRDPSFCMWSHPNHRPFSHLIHVCASCCSTSMGHWGPIPNWIPTWGRQR